MSRTGWGWHYTRCGGGGDSGGGESGGAVVLVVAAVFILAAVAGPVARAADVAGRVVLEVLEIAGIVLASAAGLAVLAAAAWGARRAVRWHARNRQALSRHSLAVLPGYEALRAAQEAVLAARRPAIENRGHVIPGVVVSEKERNAK